MRLALWDRAQWRAVYFPVSSVLGDIPVFALVFRDRDAALKIFSALQEEVGERDGKNLLRVSVIRGTDAENPTWYRILIGSNPDVLPARPGYFVITTTRTLSLRPSASGNLDTFVGRYKRTGTYALVPATGDGPDGPIETHTELVIIKAALSLRMAWEIGLNDPDVGAIFADDKPVLPEVGVTAPVIDLLAHKNRPRGKGPHEE